MGLTFSEFFYNTCFIYLQRKPSYRDSFEKISMKDSSNELILGFRKEKCPKGTVPIRRTAKDELIQGKLSFYNQSMVQDVPGVHVFFFLMFQIL